MIWARIRSLASALWRRSRMEDEMAAELDFHIASRADDLMARHALDRREAMRRARLEFGSLDKYKEQGREARGLAFFEALRADFRYSFGQLRKYPMFTATAVLTIAVGVAVNAATFNIVNASLFKPLPARDPDQLTRLATVTAANPVPSAQLAFADYRDLKDAEAFEDIAAWGNEFHGLTVDGRTDRVLTSAVTGNFFAMLGVQPSFGRLIRPADGELGGREPVLVLGYSYWAHRLAKDPSVIGKQIKLSGQPFTVIGVLPDAFHGADNLIEFDAYFPIELSVISPFLSNRSLATVRAIARLKPGVDIQHAQAALDTVSFRLQREYPATNANRTISVFPERRSRPDPALVNVMPTVVLTLLALSGSVLLIASVNVLSLLLARGLARRGEMAIRAALGAYRWQLVRVCFSEAVLIAVFGGVLGVMAASWGTSLLGSIRPKALAGVALRMDVGMDWRVAGYATILIAITALIVGLIPALRSARTMPHRDLHDSKATGAPQRQRLRQSLVVVQLAVSVAFLVVAGMFIQSLYNLESLDLGFRSDRLLLADVDPATGGYYDGAQIKSLFDAIETRLSALPGVQTVSQAALRPFGDSMLGTTVLAEGKTPSSTEETLGAEANVVTPRYFETMEIPLVRGRDFQDSDGPASRTVTIVNDTLAAQLWPGEDAIGKRFKTSIHPDLMLEVVGIVRASKQENGLQPRKPPLPQMFIPAAQATGLGQTIPTARTFYIRTRIPPERLAATVQSEIRSVDANVAVNNVTTMDDQVRQSLNGFGLARAAVAVSVVIGALALLLALVGTYGSLSWMVGQRVQEIGVRIALGADRATVLRMIIYHGLKLAVLGAVAGVLAGGAIGRLLQLFLFDVSPLDPLVLIPVVLLLLATAFLTCIIPARRATRIDPILALKCE